MLAFLTSGDNVPFLAALLLMLLIGVVEALGLGGSAALGDGLNPPDMDGDVDGHASLLNWLNVGKLPLLMLIVVFLFSFGLVGLILQQVIAGIFGRPGPWWLAVPLAMVAALPFTRLFGRVVARILPTDETTAVARDTLVGRWATIVIGKAEVGSAAQARVRDFHGQTHYVMIEPDDAGEVFEEGSQVIIVRHAGARFFAIQNTSASLRDL
ncbi:MULTISPECIES: YqiJ family protein [unclassified Caulobacter]|uniref:YqiJ family protein n=1 Tax=unclassified Caulobacter TaxID=2648921 RepID=UPI000D3325E0|nr:MULTISPECIES: YqiJ family protein [unclassified Caulobacter]PTS88905.1 hypothetical protein DBR21_08160 [Caulobacter sp. HMWF009]PTT05653.1 hypothetical protein DBR10_15320 [Caulobacter sp. HMWF025]